MQNKEDKQSYDSLISAYLKGELTSAEFRELTDWIRLHKENKRYFDECCAIWITARTVENTHNYNVQKAFWNFKQKLGVPVTGQLNSGRKRSLMIFARYAAIILISFSLSGILLYFIGKEIKQEPDSSYSELVIPFGSRAKFLLPDGTVVNLNAGSRLRQDKMYGAKERSVELEGEAYFIVARDHGKPFIVKTGNLNITAVGTEFNVKAYPGDKTVVTTLVEGGIKVEPISGDKDSFILKPNQKLTFFKDIAETDSSLAINENVNEKIQHVEIPNTTTVPRFIKEDVNVLTEISWKENLWIFEHKNLSDIATELERRYDVKINIESERLKDFKFTGTIIEEPIEQVLELMSITAPIEYSLKGRMVTMREKRNFEELNKTLYNR